MVGIYVAWFHWFMMHVSATLASRWKLKVIGFFDRLNYKNPKTILKVFKFHLPSTYKYPSQFEIISHSFNSLLSSHTQCLHRIKVMSSNQHDCVPLSHVSFLSHSLPPTLMESCTLFRTIALVLLFFCYQHRRKQRLLNPKSALFLVQLSSLHVFGPTDSLAYAHPTDMWCWAHVSLAEHQGDIGQNTRRFPA
jgi:hypothetical protein